MLTNLYILHNLILLCLVLWLSWVALVIITTLHSIEPGQTIPSYTIRIAGTADYDVRNIQYAACNLTILEILNI